jgi:hypothetical protein
LNVGPVNEPLPFEKQSLDVVIDPGVLDLINKTFYNASVEKALLLKYNITNESLFIYSAILANLSESTPYKAMLLVRTDINNSVMHNHIFAGYCYLSNMDRMANQDLMAVYCAPEQRIIFELKNKTEVYTYELS